LSFGSDDERWAAVMRRDRQADGMFYYSVVTTGVYGRPSCAARLARRENVRFFDTREDAERASFRPCGRCRPDEPTVGEQHAAAVARACRLIEFAHDMPTLDELADVARFSRFHFHRIFKAVMGMTPHEYVAMHRAERVREELSRSETVTEAIYRAGFNSNGNFYAASAWMLGMTPTSFRSGGQGTCIHFAVHERLPESVLVAATEKGVCAVLIGDDPRALVRELEDRFPQARLVAGDWRFTELVADAVGAAAPKRDLPAEVRGHPLRHGVWQALRNANASGWQLTHHAAS
jgi:AraC family transcriptional regulator of adaptative response/methylated-DNA-[protein]-cysteine methyltransferase